MVIGVLGGVVGKGTLLAPIKTAVVVALSLMRQERLANCSSWGGRRRRGSWGEILEQGHRYLAGLSVDDQRKRFI